MSNRKKAKVNMDGLESLIEKVEDPNRFPCRYCLESFAKFGDWTRHMVASHYPKKGAVEDKFLGHDLKLMVVDEIGDMDEAATTE